MSEGSKVTPAQAVLSIFEKIHSRRATFIRKHQRDPIHLILNFKSWFALKTDIGALDRIQGGMREQPASYYGMIISVTVTANSQEELEYIEIA